MRIVDVCGFYTPYGGGIRTYVEQKLALADRFGHDVTILAPDAEYGVREVGPGARIIGLPSPRFPLDRKYFAFTDAAPVHAELDRLKPDFVEASSPWRSASIAMSWPGDVPRAFIMHSEPLSAHVYRWFERLASTDAVDRQFDWFWERLREFGRNFDAVVCANSNLAARMQGGGVGNVFNLPMGVEPGVFDPAHRDEALRAELLAECDLGPDATLLVTAGRLANEKRVPMLVEAATLAGHERPIGLAIFGEGRARDKIVRAIAGNPHIRLFKPVRDRARFAAILASADALLHGCEAETYGMTTAEARASGIPVIAPDRGGASDFTDPPLRYRAADADDAVRAILALPRRFVPAPPTHRVRSMVDHFEALFALYARIAQDRGVRAA
ncbi:glycosyltransferase [Qipengyuania sediminis]|uniref:glycosyltransferase n=1 Tax=Qipengyuania sediminis TaxID=1532023 RepID=UPI001059FE5A|nr:glycosyltransferase [Qipengyuania sediminis]